MAEEIALGLGLVFVVGVGAQWIAWRLRLPAILLLLVFGIAAGSTGLLHPDDLFGDLILPIVSIAVALILFEGGLSLDLHEIRGIGSVLVSLVTVGVVVTWLLIAAAAHWLLEMPPGLSMLLGAMLVVTGPTVIGPLLRHVRPTGPAASLLKWEGIVIDPIGVFLALVVFECLVAPEGGNKVGIIVAGIGKSVVIGSVFGWLGGKAIHVLLRRYLVPDFLQNPVIFAVVIGAFVGSNALQHEAGLLTVTVMGAYLANQKTVAMHHIIEFKENLRVLLISSIFIVLAARLEISQLRDIGLGGLGFITFLILIVRPLSVVASTLRSSMSWKDRAFVMWMAPRGVVAAAVSSSFALALEQSGRFEAGSGAERFIPITFAVIIATVTVYGLTASWVGRKLGVAGPTPQGVLLLGAHAWARSLARALTDQGLRVVLLDRNRRAIMRARLDGLEAHWGDALAESTIEQLDFGGLGRLFALTPNHEVNVLAAQHFTEVFGRTEVYRLAPTESGGDNDVIAQDSRGRVAGERPLDYDTITTAIRGGALDFRATQLSDTFDLDAWRACAGEGASVFGVVRDGKLTVASPEKELETRAGDTIVALAAAREPTTARAIVTEDEEV